MSLLGTLGTLAGGFFGVPTGAMIGGALAGGLGGSKQGGTTTTSTEVPAWMRQYLDGPNGIYSAGQNQFNQGQWSPEMGNINDLRKGSITSRMPGQNQQFTDTANNFMGGAYDFNTAPLWTPGADFYKKNMAGNVSSQSVDPTQAFSSFGAANPTSALSRSLSGQIDTSTLDPVVNNAMRRMGENFNEQVLPGINQGAVAAGQYGGSRQGIAQGLAAKGLAYGMGDAAASMYNNAYQDAQGRMTSTANNLAGLAINNSQQNANRDLNAQQFNAGQLNDMLKFGVNTQQSGAKFTQNNQSADARDNVQNRLTGLNLLNQGNQNQDYNYNQWMGSEQAPNDYNWGNTKNYSDIIKGGNNGSTTSTPYYTNPTSNILGGAMMGGQLGSMMGGGYAGDMPMYKGGGNNGSIIGGSGDGALDYVNIMKRNGAIFN